ncbi:hypothetical protein QN366_05015 [Pseudomonas sp. CCC3.2]|uniref:hypothetical protein n=1 Tax=unclassified Pseudomonas TaxID=196821 RepID=UPI002AB537EF|nr:MULTISPECIES: hypothetical protein [unclassified Pseudomonas]MDY7559925.1 hypothetical protein [Pseudomonas sp. AB6]MEA9994571.1 hypothetical protein [Pseudomonas sp. AA4]MEB0085716.1 hypothetical protein [Pseudomonas sp. RTI1]MEB0125959.1 hypothetical protein [Pseudomonas sp. CCC1.2]MEB0152763.1 hypothetical protein [Pseudomonas sp. CCC4.3]
MSLPDDPTPALLFRLNQNINAAAAAVEEIGIWIGQRGSTEVSERIAAHLQVLTDNSDFIAEQLVELVSRHRPEGDPPD